MKPAAVRVERGRLALTPCKGHDRRRAASDDTRRVSLEADSENVTLGHAECLRSSQHSLRGRCRNNENPPPRHAQAAHEVCHLGTKRGAQAWSA